MDPIMLRGGADALPGLHAPRFRLVEQLLMQRRAIVEAGAGFGKSTLAIEYGVATQATTLYVPLQKADGDADRMTALLRRAFRGSGWSDLSAAMDVDEPTRRIDALLDGLASIATPTVIIVDDAHHLSGEAAAAGLLRLVHQLPGPHRILVAARWLVSGLEVLRDAPTVACLGTADLTFTRDEIHSVARRSWGVDPSDQVVTALREVTGGWATAVVLAVSAGSPDGPTGPTPRRVGTSNSIAPLLEPVLARLEPADRETAVQLAHLPMLSAEIVATVSNSDGAFGRLVAAGMPIARMASGWWELPGPVVSVLQARGPLTASVAVAAAEIYQRSGETLPALRLLTGAGLDSSAARLLGALGPTETEELGFAVLDDIATRLPHDVSRAHPRMLLTLARVAEASHRNDVRTALLDRLSTLLDDPTLPDRERVRREVSAEVARDLMWDERSRARSRELAEWVVLTADADELLARARALDVLGRLASWFSDAGPLPEAEQLLTESARLARLIGHRTWVAQALTALGVGYYLAICRFELARQTLEEALSDLPARSSYRAMVQSLRADLLTEVGRRDEAEAAIAEIRAIGNARREEWTLAYASWSEMLLASYLDDAPRTVAAAAEVERHRDVWFDQASGVEFLAQAADSLARAGQDELALSYLERARARMSGNDKVVSVYGAATLARSGDPADALRYVQGVLARQDIDPQERWPLLLMRAYVAHRVGDPDTAELAADAFEAAAALGHPHGPELREPRICRILLPAAAGIGNTAALMLQERADRFTVTALGGFAVRRGRDVVLPPTGRPTLAVKAVVAAGGRVRVDVLTEILWPNTPSATSRNRLRNLLSRLHSAIGPLLSRDGDAVCLANGTATDALTFETEARQVLSASAAAPGVTARARSAVDRYHGDLLPEDMDQPWASGRRERLRRHYLALLDLLAADAVTRGEVDEAIRLTERGVDVETHDEQRYLRLAELLVAHGRYGTARTVLSRLRNALADLDVEPTTRYVELEALLRLPTNGD